MQKYYVIIYRCNIAAVLIEEDTDISLLDVF